MGDTQIISRNWWGVNIVCSNDQQMTETQRLIKQFIHKIKNHVQQQKVGAKNTENRRKNISIIEKT